MNKTLVLKEEGNSIWEKTMQKSDSLVGFNLMFLNKKSSHAIHRVDVRGLNLQDILRHLRHGESVLISPKLENSSISQKKLEDQAPWYFVRT